MLKPYTIPHSTPENLGISPDAIVSFIKAIESNSIEMHTFKIIRHGQIAIEGAWAPYHMDDPHILFSLSKTVSATAIGLAVQEGLLTVDDLLIDIFPEYVTKEIAVNMADLRIRHVLAMATGHDVETGEIQRKHSDDDWIKAFFDTPLVHPPGTYFLYNSGGSFMLSAIIQKVTGVPLIDYVRPRLFDPLGIEYAEWEANPRGMSVGASGLHMTVDAVARLGLLFLQKGMFNGTRILTEAWVEEASSYHTNNNPNNERASDWKSGYGYQMWRNLQPGAYRGDGAFGQFCIILPDLNAVIAITAGTNKNVRIAELVNEHLIPAFTDVEPIIEAAAADASHALHQTIARLAYIPPFIQADCSESSRISGSIYNLEANTKQAHAVSFTFDDEHTCTFRTWDARGEHMIRCGSQDWIIGETLATENEWVEPIKTAWAVAASGTWQDEMTYVMTWRFIRTSFVCTVTCRFDGDRVSIDYARNLSFYPYEIPTIHGTIA
jgi:CubicO group peptidase (beta-lactamase class C family)